MEKQFISDLYKVHLDCQRCPNPSVIHSFFKELLGTLFPDFSNQVYHTERGFELHIEKLKLQLDQILHRNPSTCSVEAEKVVNHFFGKLPQIYNQLKRDISAMYLGDPAAKSEKEVIRTYPGFLAIAAYRIAHVLFQLEIQIIPRMITEYAHSKTGIDIHPGAQIGNHFCIDHGTGVVVGETTVIGDHVKIYQGVTLGALSVNKEDAKTKRHPSIGNNVVIYAGATILGGKTLVGDHSIIGGNVWLTKSVPPYSKLYYFLETKANEETY